MKNTYENISENRTCHYKENESENTEDKMKESVKNEKNRILNQKSVDKDMCNRVRTRKM